MMKSATQIGVAAAWAGLLLGLAGPTLAQRAATPQAAPTPPASTAPRPAESSAKGAEVVARVGTSDITADEVRSLIATLDPRQQASLARDPALLSQALRTLLGDRLVLKEALAKRWEQQAVVAAQIERARQSVIVESYLRSVATPPDGYPNEEEIRTVYDANATAFLVPRRFLLAQITVAVPKEADKATEEKARRKAEDEVKKLKQPGANFAALAKSDSDDSETAEKGGELGWLTEAQLRPEIRSQVIGLAKGAFTDPLRLDDGWHILKLTDTEAAHTRPLTEVRDALAQRMRAERMEANRRAYVAELLKQSPPIVNELALSKLLETAPTEPAR